MYFLRKITELKKNFNLFLTFPSYTKKDKNAKKNLTYFDKLLNFF